MARIKGEVLQPDTELRERRLTAVLSQAQAAFYIGVSDAYLSACERGVKRLSVAQRRDLMNYYLSRIAERLKGLINQDVNSNIGAGAEAPSLAEECRETCSGKDGNS